jgi:hypothetical protein
MFRQVSKSLIKSKFPATFAWLKAVRQRSRHVTRGTVTKLECGLRAYFSGEELSYVPPSDPDSIRRALKMLASDDELRFEMMTRAQVRMRRMGLSSRAYAGRFRDISKRLLSEQPIKSDSLSRSCVLVLPLATLDRLSAVSDECSEILSANSSL